MNLHEYYNNPENRQRIKNFFTDCSWFLTAGSHFSRDPNWGEAPPVRVFRTYELDEKLGQGPDIYRPITSKSGVLGVLDIEYSNWDKFTLFRPSDDGRTFGVHDDIFRLEIEPVYQELKKAFGDEAIIDTTWSGYHFLTNLKKDSVAYKKLLELGWGNSPRCLEDSLVKQYFEKDTKDLKRESGVALEDGIVYNQFGKLMEFLCHRTIKKTNDKTFSPITLCDTDEVCISLDISQYADPVYMRIIRSAFSTWDKHNMNDHLRDIVRRPAFVDIIRRYGCWETDDLENLFAAQLDFELATEHHKQFGGFIPTAGKAIEKLIDEYERSDLRQFHLDFDSVKHDSDDENYKRAKYDSSLPLRLREMMEHPNPLLLQPRNILWASKVLLDKGWHPKHIGGMITGRYKAQGKGWKTNQWVKYNAETRANFWARIYTGLLTHTTNNI